MSSRKSISQQREELKRKLEEAGTLLLDLQDYKEKLEAAHKFKTPLKQVKFTGNEIIEQPKSSQQKITLFLKPTKREIVRQIFEEILTETWIQVKQSILLLIYFLIIFVDALRNEHKVLIDEEAGQLERISSSIQDLTSQDLGKRVKVSYSNSLKTRVIESLKTHTLHTVYLLNKRRIPTTTLSTWKASLQVPTKKKGTQGRKTKLRILEEELFSWFLMYRARKIVVADHMFQKKAKKIQEEIAEDNNLSAHVKALYIDFKASNGWIDKFKKRYNITRRYITTVCSKSIEEMREAITTYFTDLSLKMKSLNPKFVYNMDEVGIFFEMETKYTLEIKGKKIVGKITSGKSKERLTLVVTASSNGSLLPPFIIFKVK